MRIKSFEICNYRGLYGRYEIDLTNSCKNLMLYGENGSGKSSICHALQTFIRSSVDAADLSKDENIFIEDEERGKVSLKVFFREENQDIEYGLGDSRTKTDASFLRETNKIRGILSYKNLLQVHHAPMNRANLLFAWASVSNELPRKIVEYLNIFARSVSGRLGRDLESDHINVFDLFIENLLVNTPSSLMGKTIGQRWENLNEDVTSKRNSRKYKSIPENLDSFNADVKTLMEDLQVKVNEIIEAFDQNTEIRIKFDGIVFNAEKKYFDNKNIRLEIKYHKVLIQKHHTFLNEARLTAIAISVYFASILTMPQETDYKILILDDILIGLDMSNRMALLTIFEKYFGEYQIFITTHDRQWYESVHLTVDHSKWQFAEIYTSKHHQKGFDVPVLKCGDRADFISVAENYLNKGDFKAATVYVRTAFEQVLTRYCNKRHLRVRFSIKPSKITSEDLWQAVKETNKVEKDLCDEIESCRALVMNPFSHYDIHNLQFRSELENAIAFTKNLKDKLC